MAFAPGRISCVAVKTSAIHRKARFSFMHVATGVTRFESLMKNVAIVSSGYLPVPDVLGGAVEGLITCIARENGRVGDLDLTVYTMDDPEARRAAETFGASTRLEFVPAPGCVRAADRCIYWVAKNVLRKKNMSWGHILQRVHFLRSVARLIAEHEADVLVLENHPTQCMVLDRCGNAERYRGKTLLHLHNEVTSDFGYRRLLEQASGAVRVSSFIARSFAGFMGWGSDDDRLLVLHNCAIDSFFTRGRDAGVRAATRARLGVGEDEFVVLFSGRLTAEKGASELLDAFSRAAVANPRLLIAGAYFFKDGATSPFEEELKRKAAALGDKVIFTGFVDHDEMADLYSACDIVCNPSIWDDPTLLANIEGLASGKPVVSTYSGGVPEYVDDTCGVLVERGDGLVDGLAKAIARLAGDPGLRERLGAGACEAARDLDTTSYYSRSCEIVERF